MQQSQNHTESTLQARENLIIFHEALLIEHKNIVDQERVEYKSVVHYTSLFYENITLNSQVPTSFEKNCLYEAPASELVLAADN